jgi:CheY-like chemotaxis protein
MTSTCTEPIVYGSDPRLGLHINVLLVEDDREAAILTWTRVIQPHSDIFQVEWKSTISTAISRLVEPGIDAVLLDLGMPELGLDETLPAIVSVVGKTIPIVILTADDSAVSHEVASLQGAVNYLIKHRTSSFELRQALYEAVIPAMNSKPPSDVGSTIGKTARHFVTRILLGNLS